MEIAKNCIASGSIRDLPPSKRFKFVNSDPGPTPCLPLPAKKRVFPRPPPAAAAVPVCLPAKKRAIVAPPSEDAIPVCLPAKKRAYAPPADAVIPACLPAKKRPYAPTPADLVGRPCIPTKKRVNAPPPRDDAAGSVPFPASSKKRVHAPPPREEAAGAVPVPVPSKKLANAPPPREVAAGSVPVPVPSKQRVHAPPSLEDAAVSVPVPVPSKKRDHAPSSRRDTVGLVSVSLPTNKRVMPPLPPPSVESDGARLGAVKDVKPQGSSKHGAHAINPRLANGAEGGSRGKEIKKLEKPNHPKEAKELVPMKPCKTRSLIKLKDLEKNACKVLDVRHSKAEAEVNKKAVEVTHPKQSAHKEESRNASDEVARDEELVKPSKPRCSIKGKDLEKKACKILDVRHSKAEVEVSKKAVQATNAKQEERKEESRNATDEVARDQEQEIVEDDDGVLCVVCGSTDGDPSDPIVFCDGCDLMVHASCYGNPLAQSIPDGDWFCSLCSAKKGKAAAAAPPSCCLCPATGGAMKRTTEGQWAHIACALLVPEVFFRDPDGRDGINCSRVPAHRFTKECYICESSSGCALECSQPKCSRGFHVSCGLDGGLCIEYREEKGGAIVAGFCREHTELWEKQQLTGKYKIVARGHE